MGAYVIKTLYILVDVVVCTVLAMRASDGAAVGGFGNGVIVVLEGKRQNKFWRLGLILRKVSRNTFKDIYKK